MAFYTLAALFCAAATVFLAAYDLYIGQDDILFALLFICFWFFLMCGIFLNGQIKNKRESIRLAYLSYPFVHNDDNC